MPINWHKLGRQRISKGGRDTGKETPSCITGENGKWGNFSAKQSGNIGETVYAKW